MFVKYLLIKMIDILLFIDAGEFINGKRKKQTCFSVLFNSETYRCIHYSDYNNLDTDDVCIDRF